MLTAQSILVALLAYAGIGLVFGLAFVGWGVSRVDPGARGAGVMFRLMILPGTAALWPLLASRWLRAGREDRT